MNQACILHTVTEVIEQGRLRLCDRGSSVFLALFCMAMYYSNQENRGVKATMGGGRGGGLLLFSVLWLAGQPAGRPAGVDLVLLCVCMPQSPT